MSRHSISEAAILSGKSRATLYAHLKAGKLSCGKNHDGTKYIDHSELLRVYGPSRQVERTVEHSQTELDDQSNIQSVKDAEIEGLKKLLALQEARIVEFKDQLAKSESREQQLQERVLQLEYQPEAKQTKKGSLFKRFGQSVVDVLP